jgi:xeroderma pigmentosum group C-complementing protein
MADGEMFFSKEDFQSQAKILQGSRDFGAQLFCALLRSAAVEARLVCSLQPLPFSGTVKDMTPSKKPSQYIVISSDDHDTSTDEQQKSPSGLTTPSRTRRIGRPGFTSRPAQSSVRLGMRDMLIFYATTNLHRPSTSSPRIPIPGVLGRSIQRGGTKMDSNRSIGDKVSSQAF